MEAEACFSSLTQNAHGPHFCLLLTPARAKGGTCAKAARHLDSSEGSLVSSGRCRGAPPSAASLPWCSHAPRAAAAALVLTAAKSISRPALPPQLQTSISLPPDSPSGHPMVPQTGHPFQTQALILFPKKNIILDKFIGPRKQGFPGTCRKAQRDCTDF